MEVATYVPMIMQLLMWLTKLCIAQNTMVSVYLWQLQHLHQRDISQNLSYKFGTSNMYAGICSLGIDTWQMHSHSIGNRSACAKLLVPLMGVGQNVVTWENLQSSK